MLGHILAEDKQVHAAIVTNSATIAEGIAAVLADGVVTDDEEAVLAKLAQQAANIGEMARV